MDDKTEISDFLLRFNAENAADQPIYDALHDAWSAAGGDYMDLSQDRNAWHKVIKIAVEMVMRDERHGALQEAKRAAAPLV